MEIDYREVLKAIEGKNVELRHDVDISLISAYNMAKIENEMGVKSIYYIRFDCDYYNPFSSGSEQMINEIHLMGHEIGLHIDSKQIESKRDLQNYISHCTFMCHFSKFTFHVNTEITKQFTDKFYSHIENKSLVDKYISDSRGEFDQTKLDWIKDNDDFTLLIHPEWWMHSGTKEEVIAKAIKEILP